MYTSASGRSLLWGSFIILACASSIALAQIEDPSIYPGAWYRIAFDDNGDMIYGDGDGSSWEYYPTAGRYRMWFNNGEYDPDRKGYLRYEAYIHPVDPSKTSYIEIYFNWTTPEWSAVGGGTPPYPEDVPTMQEEFEYMSGYHMHTVDNLGNFESIEPVDSHTIYTYNPEWISIDVIGRNVAVYRGAWHECLEKTPEDEEVNEGGFRVCCRRSTGDCYTIWGGKCEDSYETLPPGQTCAHCVQGETPSVSLDFGDAPDPSYPTLLAGDGARHTIVTGIHLGAAVDAETDGQPNATATGDDNTKSDEDGVVFTSALEPGYPATVEVTAASQGYLNAWIDFDGDGSFGGAGEQISSDVLLAPGANTLTFDVPDGAARGTTFARFRFNSRGLLGYDGPAEDGEVEDYTVQISKHYEPYPTSGVAAVRWSQPPTAIDVADPYLFETVTVLSALGLQEIAADDFQIDDSQPVTGIHWWGSFSGWAESYLPPVLPLAFHIGIWTDTPDAEPGNPTTFGHPGTLIWETYCTHWTWALAGYQEAAKEGGLGESCFQLSCPLSQDQWFYPTTETDSKGTESTFYWISVAAIYDTKGPATTNTWGWMTRPYQFGEMASVIQDITPGVWPPTNGVEWLIGKPVADGTGVPWDMAFQLTSYGPLDTGLKAEPDGGDVKTALNLRDLALAAARWLEALP
jgi:hypothetical protein